MSQCITAMLRELEATCEPAFAAILKTPWMYLENVSGRSAYIVDLVGSIKQIAEIVRARLESKKYIRNFADKAVGSVNTETCEAELIWEQCHYHALHPVGHQKQAIEEDWR